MMRQTGRSAGFLRGANTHKAAAERRHLTQFRYIWSATVRAAMIAAIRPVSLAGKVEKSGAKYASGVAEIGFDRLDEFSD